MTILSRQDRLLYRRRGQTITMAVDDRLTGLAAPVQGSGHGALNIGRAASEAVSILLGEMKRR